MNPDAGNRFDSLDGDPQPLRVENAAADAPMPSDAVIYRFDCIDNDPRPPEVENWPGYTADASEAPPSEPDPLGLWDAGNDDYEIPPREWLLGKIFCKKFLSSLIADGGVGKTALRVAQLTSLATGRSLTEEHVFRRCRVLIVSFEDDKNELRRRVYAVMRKHNIEPKEVRGWLFLAAPKRLKLAHMTDRAPAVGELDKVLREAISTLKIDVVSLDPFVKIHSMEENSNNSIDFVCDLAASIAIDLNCAIDLPHHTNKGLAVAGDANKGRGATAMKDAARLVHTLTPMTDGEAKQFGLEERERRSLVRMDSGKVNIAPPSAAAKWFRIVGIPLGNGNDAYPAGDNIQTVEPWIPPDTWEDLDHPLLNRILDDIEAGMPNGQRYSVAGAATARAVWPIVRAASPDKTDDQCRSVINAWLKSGTLFKEEYNDPITRKIAIGLRVNPAKRPS